MKFSAAATFALVVASVEGFQLSMSSGYLEQMGGARGAGVKTNYAPSGGKYAPTAPIAGGSYLDQMSSSAPAQTSWAPAPAAPAPATSWAPAPAAPAPVAAPVSSAPATTGSYLEAMGGGSTSSSYGAKKSYSVTGGSYKVGQQMGSTYLNNVNGQGGLNSFTGGAAPAPAAPAAAPASSAPATTGSYLEAMGGGASASYGAKKSYSVTGGSYKVGQQMGSTYLNSMSGGAAPAAPAASSWAPAPAAPAPAAAPASSAPATTGSYLEAMGGGASASYGAKKKSYSVTGGSYKVGQQMGSTYLNSMTGGAAPAAPAQTSWAPAPAAPAPAATSWAPAPAPVAAPVSSAPATTGSYLEAVGGAAAPSYGAKKSYAVSGGSYKMGQQMGSTYLNNVNGQGGLTSFAGSASQW